jgi:hypothetical protein
LKLVNTAASSTPAWTYSDRFDVDFKTGRLPVGTATTNSDFIVEFNDDTTTGSRIMKLWR